MSELEDAVILAMTIDPTLIAGVRPECFTGLARDAFKEIESHAGGTSIGTSNLDRLLLSRFGLKRRSGEKVRDAVLRCMERSASLRELELEYMRKRMDLAKGK